MILRVGLTHHNEPYISCFPFEGIHASAVFNLLCIKTFQLFQTTFLKTARLQRFITMTKPYIALFEMEFEFESCTQFLFF